MSSGPARLARSSSFIVISAITRNSDSATSPTTSTVRSLSFSDAGVKLVALRITTPSSRENTKSGRMKPLPSTSRTSALPPARQTSTTNSVLISEREVTSSATFFVRVRVLGRRRRRARRACGA